MNKTVGIIGGVGPEAGRLLHGYIIKETPDVNCDQDHLDVVHISASSSITDRTKFLLGEVDENPAEGVIKVVELMNLISESTRKKIVAAVPCNTFHAKPIFNQLTKLIKEKGIENIDLLNMVQETALYIKENFPECKNVGLMSTTGTRDQRIYHDLLEPEGLGITEVDTSVQKDLHDTIYNSSWGIKAVSPVTEKAKSNFETYAQQLIDNGAEVIILGCTEIPLALEGNEFNGITLLDPMQVIAKRLIKKAKGE